MESLRTYFKSFGPLSDENLEYMLQNCDPKTLHKGDWLIHPHQHVDSIYFIESGFLHYFTHNDFGERVTLKVISPNHCWTVLDSFYNQKTTADECQALTEVRYCEIDRTTYNAVKAKNHELANFIQSITEQILSSKVIEANKISMMTVEERYLDLLHSSPQMIQEVPVQIIASYIGTSRETLHRIRRKLKAA